MKAVDSVPPIQNINSAFQMAEYLNLLVQADPHNIPRIVEVPEYHSHKSSRASSVTTSEGKEQDLWIYEHLRRLPIDLTPLTVSLLRECTPQTCPEMKAGEWQYICVANHQARTEEEGRSVMQEAFPSRISIKPGSERYFGTQSRRISRIFSHAWYAHRELFEEAEAETALYKRFLALMKRYELMNLSLLVIPGDAYDTPTVLNGSATQSPTDQASDQRPQHKHTASVIPNSKTSTSEISNSKASERHESDDSQKAIKKDEDDADFRRDLFATPVTATRIDHGFKNMLRGDGTGSSRGTLGRGRGKGVRKALFPVDVPAEEEDDEVDIHVEHVGTMMTDENGKGKVREVEGRNKEASANGTTEKKASSVADEEPKATVALKRTDNGHDANEEDEEKAELNITADGVEFNV
ncbi:hypothetical protein QFC21_002376 [Naganishia friedmannii]|uniref:Uncharacterized protein n=1 Tax=Naganishia friedmannii TaxID=89922 RepID=A0ACC2VWW1_9TREE|nr:hypothetical protein QFC21_002376 [Naganishia friedmannii]